MDTLIAIVFVGIVLALYVGILEYIAWRVGVNVAKQINNRVK